jgi:hypothetical protein
MTADCFVNSAIGPRADEADDLVAVDDTNFALVADVWTDSSITRVKWRSSGGKHVEMLPSGRRSEGAKSNIKRPDLKHKNK